MGIHRELRNHGYIHVPGVVAPAMIDAANAAIDADLAAHYHPERLQDYLHRSFCPRLRRAPVITGLLAASPARDLVDEVLAWRRLRGASTGQIAVRHAHEVPHPIAPDWHIDGVPTAENGLLGGRLQVFTALVGIFLTPSREPHTGNFTVFPQSTRRLRDWYRSHGRPALRRGRPAIDPGPPHPLLTEPGDVVVANYLLAHATTSNAGGRERRAVFFRLALPRAVLHPYRCVTHPWRGWRSEPRSAR